jgi:release factor glutamine methyltransferase
LNSVLDVATGSGVVPISLALKLPGNTITATDISPDALSLAIENATLLGVNHISFHEADLMPPGNEQYELITANLPYIPTAEIATLSREVRHDPLLALDGGPEGLDLIQRLAPLALERLATGGHLLLEIGIGQSEQVMYCLKRHNYRDIVALPDYQGISRFIEAVKG